MKLEQGLATDNAEVDQPAGTYRFAKNMVDSNTPGAKENELGFIQKNWGYTYPFLGVAAHTVIGVIPVNVGCVVFSTDEINSEIGLYNNVANTYTLIYNDGGNALNFKRTTPIKGEYRITATGHREIHWIDDGNPPRILDIDNAAAINSVNDLNIFQDVQNPAISTYSIADFGGSLPTGAYIPITLYKGLDGSVTNWYVHDKVFYINDDPKTSAFNVDDGATGLSSSNKAINLTLINCDTNYDTIVVGLIRVANQVTTAFSAITKTVSSTINVTITGAESLTSITLDEILTANSVYGNAKAITQVNNQLVLANLSSTALPNLQQVANGIGIHYAGTVISVISNTNSHKDVLPLGLMPGDVYAFYLGVELNKGGWAFYHIPGRAPVAGETAAVTTADGLSYLKYQVEDTSDGAGASSNMGFWQNTTETYPNNTTLYGSLAGQNVRHHRMPTVAKMENSFYSSNPNVGVTQLIRLGIGVFNVNIPPTIQAQIKRWKIFFAKKSSNDSIIGGSDLLHYPVSPTGVPGTYWTTGGNWRIDAPHSGWQSMGVIHPDAILGHCLDHLYASNEFTPDFAYFNYGLTNNCVIAGGINKPYAGFRGGGSELSSTGVNRGQCAGIVLDYTEPSTTKIAVGLTRKLNSYQLVPQNALVGVFKSAYAESFFTATMSPLPVIGGLFTSFPTLQTKASTDVPPSPYQWNSGEQTIYMQYGKIVSNAHTSFTSQDLVPMEGYAAPSETQSGGTGTVYFNGGDTFLCYMSYLTAAPLNGNHATTSGNPGFEGVRAWKAYVGYSRRNWNYRHQVLGNTSTYYYGKTEPTTLYSPPLTIPVNTAATGNTGNLLSSFNAFNQVTYNPDFNSSNVFTTGTNYSVDVINATSFPNLIIWSALQGSESADVSWRFFPAANRYTMPKNKGATINLQGINNRDLIIHHEGSIYRTSTAIGLQSNDGEDVNLKSNELFTITPQELVSSSTWYGGTQNKFSCLVTKVGYVYVDDLQGKVFLLNESLEEISTNGMRKFFRDNMHIQFDNAFNSNGYTVAYDETINRILLSKKQGGTSWTISYNPQKKAWISFHDYVPDHMFVMSDNSLYSIKNNSLYLHNSGAPGLFYGVTYPSIIDVVQNPEPTVDKVFVSSSWLTESYNSAGILQYTDTFNYLTCRSLDYSTNRLALSVFDNVDLLYTNNIRNLNRVWYYNDIRDISITPGFVQGFYQNYALDLTKLNTNMEWYDQRKFTDKFVICRHEYSNLLGNKLLLLDSGIEYRYATK